jgi:hypothetical protein
MKRFGLYLAQMFTIMRRCVIRKKNPVPTSKVKVTLTGKAYYGLFKGICCVQSILFYCSWDFKITWHKCNVVDSHFVLLIIQIASVIGVSY